MLMEIHVLTWDRYKNVVSRYQVYLYANNFLFTGKMKGLAFIKDPDGYWIEILNPMNMSV